MMSAELYIKFNDKEWLEKNKLKVIDKIKELKSFSVFDTEKKVVYLKDESGDNGWVYDVRFFFHENYIFFEVSSHGETVTSDLISFFDWLRNNTTISIQDEDGELSSW